MSKVQELFDEAMKLKKKDRVELATRLWDAVVPDPPGEEVSPAEWEQEWHAEIKKRSDRYHRGETKTQDAFVALEESRRRLRKRCAQ
jgi:putative addiction module component (TIGR02574 family)